MIPEKTKKIVQDRIWLIKQLIETKEHFKGYKHIQYLPYSEWTHPWPNYFALMNYLALTCFDILGQNSNWLNFESWLVAKSKREERETIFLKQSDSDLQQKIISIQKYYNDIYGVKHSFYHFMDNIITSSNKISLLESIRIGEIKLQDISNNNENAIPVRGNEIDDEEKKKAFLYKMRNSFTHEGIVMGDPGAGIFDFDKPDRIDELTGSPIYPFHDINSETNKEIKTFYSVKRWPYVLIEIIENTLLK